LHGPIPRPTDAGRSFDSAGLPRRDGGPLVTDERLARELGDADRRKVHHFGAEFEVGGGARAALLQRRQKVDAEVVARCEPSWKAHPVRTCAQVLAEFRRRWPESGAQLSEPTIRTAGHQVGFWGLQRARRPQLAEGEAPSPEPLAWEALLEMADAGAPAQAAQTLPVLSLPDGLASGSPWGQNPSP
jgi:hypothetical protein